MNLWWTKIELFSYLLIQMERSSNSRSSNLNSWSHDTCRDSGWSAFTGSLSCLSGVPGLPSNFRLQNEDSSLESARLMRPAPFICGAVRLKAKLANCYNVTIRRQLLGIINCLRTKCRSHTLWRKEFDAHFVQMSAARAIKLWFTSDAPDARTVYAVRRIV